MNWSDMAGMQTSLIERAADVYWAGRGPDDHQSRPRCAELSASSTCASEIETMKSIDELAANLNFTTAKTGDDRSVTFLPDPPRAPAPLHGDLGRRSHRRTAGHLHRTSAATSSPTAHRKVVDTDDGGQTWVYDGQELPNVGFNAVVGRPVSEYGFEPVRFDEMRRGAWDIHDRVKDMDLNGIYASLNFPSFLPGFAGQRLQQVTKDRDLALASVRAWNDWHLEVWAGSYPGRIIPCQLPWLLDPELGAKMIYENAERGFHAVTFSENPAMLGLPEYPLRVTGIR